MARLLMMAPRVARLDARKVRLAPRSDDSLYDSPRWRALTAQLKRERGERCEDPDCKTPSGPWRRIVADHVREVRDGGALFDKRGIMLRCDACHNRKTAQERARRAHEAW
jgi:hypothetical protein